MYIYRHDLGMKDLEGQDDILFNMVDFVSMHVKIKISYLRNINLSVFVPGP